MNLQRFCQPIGRRHRDRRIFILDHAKHANADPNLIGHFLLGRQPFQLLPYGFYDLPVRHDLLHLDLVDAFR